MDIYPLHLAAKSGDVESLQSLLKSGFNVNATNYEGVCALHEACLAGQLNCVQILLAQGASVNARNVDAGTPLCDACASGSVEIVKLLLKHEALVNPPLLLSSPLHEATLRGNWECMQLLIAKNAEVNATDCHFGTPLHISCYKGFINCAQVLLQAGANVNAAKTHLTSLHIAALQNNIKLVELLLEFGADVYACNNSNKRASQLLNSLSPIKKILKYYEENPRPLKWLCRLRIRLTLCPNGLNHIEYFDLPDCLKNYLSHTASEPQPRTLETELQQIAESQNREIFDVL